MIACVRCSWVACLTGGVALALIGCRDTAPTPSHYGDLGDEGRPLMATGSPWYDVTGESRRASAEWVPFREPNFDEVPEEPVAEGAGGIEKEIRDLIEEYNEVAAERDTEELLLYFIDEQQEVLKAMFLASGTVAEKLTSLRSVLQEKLPDDADRIKAVMDFLDHETTSLDLTIGEITVIGDTEATGDMPPGSIVSSIRFTLVDDEWFFEMVGLPDAAVVGAQADALLSGFDAMVQMLQSDQAPAAVVLQQLEQQVAMLKPQQAEPEEPADDAAAEPDSNTTAEEQDQADEGG